jgi:hypothetical protein
VTDTPAICSLFTDAIAPRAACTDCSGLTGVRSSARANAAIKAVFAPGGA